jgi:hypothetical protein
MSSFNDLIVCSKLSFILLLNISEIMLLRSANLYGIIPLLIFYLFNSRSEMGIPQIYYSVGNLDYINNYLNVFVHPFHRFYTSISQLFDL